MNFIEGLSPKGEVNFKLYDSVGELKREFTTPNLIVTSGKTWIASRMAGTTAPVMNSMAVGTSTTAPSLTDTAMGSEAGRVTLTSTTPSTNTVVYVATFGAGIGTGNLYEAGLFNDSAAGTMLCHTAYSLITKTASDTLTVTWTITVN